MMNDPWDDDEEIDDVAATHTKWYYIKEMWGGLGLFLVIVLWAVLAFLNGHEDRTNDVKRYKARVTACQHAENVQSCIQAVK